MLYSIIIWAVLLVALIIMGRKYVSGSASRSKRQETLDNMQSVLAQNRKYFGRENEGTSMENKKVYAVPPNKIGL